MAVPLRFVIEGDDDSKAAFSSWVKSTDKAKKKNEGLLATLSRLTIVAAGVKKAVGAVTGQFGGLLDAAKTQVDAEVKLAVALAKVTDNVSGQLNELKGYASAKQAVTEFGDEFTLQLATIGAEFGVQGKLLTRIIDATLDRSIALQRSPIEVMKVFAKFAGGVTTSLQDVGFKMQEGETRAQLLERAIKASASGMAEAIGSLPTSAFVQMNNAVGDLQESFGKIIVSTGTFQTIIGAVKDGAAALSGLIENPAGMKLIAETIDNLVRVVIRGMGSAIGWIIDFAASVVEGAETVVQAIKETANQIGIGMARIRRDVAQMASEVLLALSGLPGVGEALGEASVDMLKLAHAADRTRVALQQQRVTTDLGSASMRAAADSTRDFFNWVAALIQPARTVPDALQGIIDKLVETREEQEALSAQAGLAAFFRTGIEGVGSFVTATGEGMMEFGSLVGEGFTAIETMMDETWTRANEIQREHQEVMAEELAIQAEELGFAYQSIFSQAVVESFDEDVGVTEAFRNLGDQVRNTFVGQMSDAAFSPIKGVFGRLSAAIAKNFDVVGKIIAKVIDPVVQIVGQIVNAIIGFLFEMIGVQALASALGITASTASATAASTVAGSWGAAAVAASIATLGGALAFGPIAITQMTLGAATGKGLAVAGALGEGGLVLPQPGGVAAILAEQGEPELVTPLSKVGEVFGGGLTVQVNVNASDLDDDDEAEALGRSLGDGLVDSLLDGRDFERLRGGNLA